MRIIVYERREYRVPPACEERVKKLLKRAQSLKQRTRAVREFEEFISDIDGECYNAETLDFIQAVEEESSLEGRTP